MSSNLTSNKNYPNLNSSIQTLQRSGRWGAAIGSSSLAMMLILMARPGFTQEAVQASLAGDSAAEARRNQQASPDYTFQKGDFKLLVTPSLGLQWNDNINLTKNSTESDIILTPAVGLNANYPVGSYNLLNLSVDFGYEKYFDHNEYSTWQLNSGSGVSFDLYVKDFWINFHDRVQYSQDGAQQATVAGQGAGQFGTFENTVGLTGTWDLNNVVLSLGYDHQNILAISSQFNQINQSSELFDAKAGLRVDSALTVGTEATASFISYQEDTLNNNNIYTTGLYADWKPGNYFSVHSGAGYTFLDNSQTSSSIQGQNVDSWYANLTLTHDITDYLSYSLSGGHEITPGFQSDAVEDWYIRPSANWKLIRNVSLKTALFYEHGNPVGGQLSSYTEDRFDWYGGEFDVSYSPMRKITMSLIYRLTTRSSNVATDEYTQNLIGLQLTYTP
jgi:hypothetical protein